MVTWNSGIIVIVPGLKGYSLKKLLEGFDALDDALDALDDALKDAVDDALDAIDDAVDLFHLVRKARPKEASLMWYRDFLMTAHKYTDYFWFKASSD